MIDFSLHDSLLSTSGFAYFPSSKMLLLSYRSHISTYVPSRDCLYKQDLLLSRLDHLAVTQLYMGNRVVLHRVLRFSAVPL